eukprot:1112212-Rhodomonas_salina.1
MENRSDSKPDVSPEAVLVIDNSVNRNGGTVTVADEVQKVPQVTDPPADPLETESECWNHWIEIHKASAHLMAWLIVAIVASWTGGSTLSIAASLSGFAFSKIEEFTTTKLQKLFNF